MIRSYFYAVDGTLLRDLKVDEMKQALESRKGVLWVDLEAPTEEETGLLGPGLFGFHPLAVEDCIHAQSRPKLDDYEDYLYLVFHAWKKGDDGVLLEEVDFFLGHNFLLSHHVERRTSVADVAELVQRDPRVVFGGGADMLLHQIVDRMVDRYAVVVDSMDERVDELEEEILGAPTDASLRRILGLKRDLQELFRTVRHQRDVVGSLAREGHPVISKKARTFFRDVYDHVVRFHDTVEGLRDQVGGARDAYLSIVSNRMNAVMKGLSLVATIILPLTFVTGVYGMNFQRMPFLEEPWGFWAACGVMAALGTTMFLWFRGKGWA